MAPYAFTPDRLTDAITEVRRQLPCTPGHRQANNLQADTQADAEQVPTTIQVAKRVPTNTTQAAPQVPNHNPQLSGWQSRRLQNIFQSMTDQQEQQEMYLNLTRSLNAGRTWGVRKWVETFGRLSPRHPWGEHIFQGMAKTWGKYIHRWQIEQYADV